MEDTTEKYYSKDEVLMNIRTYINYLIKKWWLLLLLTAIGIGSGFLFYSLQKPIYDAESVFILEEKQSSLGGLGGLASQFGFDIGSMMGGGSIFAGDNILEILKSRNIIQKVLLSKVDSTRAKGEEKLIDLFLIFSGWKDKWKDNAQLNKLNFATRTTLMPPLTLQQDSVVYLAYKELIKKHLIVERVTKKGSIMRVTINAKDPVFAKLMSERMVKSTLEMYVQFKTNNANSSVKSLERKADSLLNLLNKKTYQVASSIVMDANPGLRNSAVPAELNTRDKIVLQTLYGEVIKNLEISKIALSQQTPVIQILDTPTYPLEDKRTKLFLSMLIGGIVAFLVGFMWLSLKYLTRH